MRDNDRPIDRSIDPRSPSGEANRSVRPMRQIVSKMVRQIIGVRAGPMCQNGPKMSKVVCVVNEFLCKPQMITTQIKYQRVEGNPLYGKNVFVDVYDVMRGVTNGQK